MSLVLAPTVCSAALLPWESAMSVGNALHARDGSRVTCESVVVDRVVARQTPSFYVVHDDSRTDSRMVVLDRPPVGLVLGQSVDVIGTVETLPNGERFLATPTVIGYFDSDGKPLVAPPMPPGVPRLCTKRELPAAASPLQPADPSGSAPSASVTARYVQVARFDTVGALLAARPELLSPVELCCKRIVEVGNGFMLVGDDDGSSAVKVYANVAAKPGDRVLRLSGEAHSENGRVVIYAGSGPEPYFDSQGFGGGVVVAHPGTVAYAATLEDARRTLARRSVGTASFDPSSEDTDWVYLTGQVVTNEGVYAPNEQYNDLEVGYVQGLDRTPGIRVWDAGESLWRGRVVDVMAPLATINGERLLDSPEYTNHKEIKHWADGYWDLLPRPTGITNRSLGGADLGNNPAVSGGVGLYNIGSYVTIWGEVVGKDDYASPPYIIIDDGSGVPCDPTLVTNTGTGVVVVNTQLTSLSNVPVGKYVVTLGDNVAVRGTSSVWLADGISYPCVRIFDLVQNTGQAPPVRQVTLTGSITGAVKVYDLPPATTPSVTVYCSNGERKTVTLTRDGNVGTGSYEFTDVPKTVNTTETPSYIVSAQCEGYKTRTYTQVSPPDTTRNFYLVPLRKIYVTTEDPTVLDSCSGGTYPTSATITAKVRDAGHTLLPNVAVHFRTDKGSFLETGSPQHDYTVSAENNTTGVVAATL